MKNITFLIDSGHGGFIGGKYMTDPKIGKFHTFPSGETAYEGLINRLIKKQIIERLTKAGFRAIDICPTEIDLSMTTRCKIINAICAELGFLNCILICQHSNAGKGTGFEVWTSPGQTLSDQYASIFAATFTKYFPGIAVREDRSDGDGDKEAKFTMMTDSDCPSILPEFLFFDNEQDWMILKQPVTHATYGDMVVDFAKKITT